MKVLRVAKARVTYPTGDKSFAVMQAFPAGIPAVEADPFLMCDHFGPSEQTTPAETDPDVFPIGWHPHRGMDICTYLKSGVGRHADSLGNRGNFHTPGMQWISVGSGIEHAEGGGTPMGMINEGFQLWFNVPSSRKMDDPVYGTEDPNSIPLVTLAPGAKARLLSGPLCGSTGPFKTIVPIQMMDLEMEKGSKTSIDIPPEYDNTLIYVYNGKGLVQNTGVEKFAVLRFDGTTSERVIEVKADEAHGLSLMIFSGKMIKEQIAWHGPFVMNTNPEIQETIREYQRGEFPPVRAKWDYKKWNQFPPDKK
ncbi:MAG: hypothetical protein SGCHY_004040 [Lobulomycetales sp.]